MHITGNRRCTPTTAALGMPLVGVRRQRWWPDVWPVVSCDWRRATTEHGRSGADDYTASGLLPLS
jgi:hypothetical protein